MDYLQSFITIHTIRTEQHERTIPTHLYYFFKSLFSILFVSFSVSFDAFLCLVHMVQNLVYPKCTQ